MSKRKSTEPSSPEPNSAPDSAPPSPDPKKVKNEMPLNDSLMVIHGSNKYRFDVNNVILGSPKQLKTSKRADVSYRVKYTNGTSRDVPLVFQTPVLSSNFGFSQYKYDKNDSTAKTKLSMDATFRDENSAVLATIRAFDAKLVELIQDQMSSFLPKKKQNAELVDLMYTPLVKTTEKDGVVYSPFVRFKIMSFEQDGVISANVKCFTADSKKDGFEEIEVGELGAGCEFRAFCSFEGVYVSPKAFCPIIRADQLQKISDGKTDGFAFHDGEVTQNN